MSLNKINLLALILVTMLSGAAAQAGPMFGLKGGVNFSSHEGTTNGTIALNTSSKMGFGGGLAMDWGFTNNIGLLVDVQYMIRENSSLATKSRFAYLHIPLQLRFSFLSIMYVGVGGYFASGLGTVKNSLNGTTRTYAAARYKTSDFGATGTLGVKIPLGKEMFIPVELRYNFGLADQNSPVTAGSAKWRSFDILTGFMF